MYVVGCMSYAQPDVLVSTRWVREHLREPSVRVVEVGYGEAEGAPRVPGAVALDWRAHLQERVSRDIIPASEFERLMGGAGITPGHTVVVYGGENNRYAAFGFWLMKYYGHADVRLMNGGKEAWLADMSNPVERGAAQPERAEYRILQTQPQLRARISEVLQSVNRNGRGCAFVDVRSPEEYSGEVVAPRGEPEMAQRAGRIPGARSVPWERALEADGTFRSAEALRELYIGGEGAAGERPTIVYCRVGERSSHTWFVLKYLVGVPEVKNYDGSWAEYGNLVGAPIERG